MNLASAKPDLGLRARWTGPGLTLLAHGVWGAVLGAASLDWWVGPLPLALALVAATPDPLFGAAALLGGASAYLIRWGWYEGFEPAMIGLMIFLAEQAFRRTGWTRTLWFGPVAAFAFTCAIRLAWMLALPFSWSALVLFLLYSLIAAAAALAFGRMRRGSSDGVLLLCAGLTLGLTSLPLPLDLGAVFAGAVTLLWVRAGANGLAAALLTGVALELPGGFLSLWPGLLGLGALAASHSALRSRAGQSLVFLGAAGGLMLLCGGGARAVLEVSLGSLLGLILPLRVFDQQASMDQRLHQAARSLTVLGSDLAPAEPEPEGAALIFDRATDRVCRDCPQAETCWEREQDATYRVLSAAAPPMLARGRALREDFPETFAVRCRQFDALVLALDQELEQQLCRRKYSARVQEAASVALGQLHSLAGLLDSLAGAGRITGLIPEQFLPELSVLSAGRFSRPISGDRTAAFRAGPGVLYILLCDGMGTGEEAARESRRAAAAIQGLLQAGADPERALELLNGVCVLRGDGAFSTVDLAQVSLLTGRVRLYKWGAAASWVVRDGEAVRLGAASPPPGLDAQARAQVFSEQLGPGDYLVLLTDGIGDTAAAQALSDLGPRSTRDLATRLLSKARTLTGEADDMTAAVLCLHPSFSPGRRNRQTSDPAANRTLEPTEVFPGTH